MEHLSPQILIRAIASGDVVSLHEEFSHSPWSHPVSRWDNLLAAHNEGARHVVVALTNGALAGYCSLLYRSEYPPFEEADVPEIHNLAVTKRAQRMGVGRKLVLHLEGVARNLNYLEVGVGVGLGEKFGQAQRLYAKLGYIPDGRGITSADCQRPSWGFPILWLTKTLDLAQ